MLQILRLPHADKFSGNVSNIANWISSNFHIFFSIFSLLFGKSAVSIDIFSLFLLLHPHIHIIRIEWVLKTNTSLLEVSYVHWLYFVVARSSEHNIFVINHNVCNGILLNAVAYTVQYDFDSSIERGEMWFPQDGRHGILGQGLTHGCR